MPLDILGVPGLGGPAQPRPEEQPLGFGEGFLKSTLWSPLSLLGVDAPAPVETWRQEHPFGSLGSQLIGYSVPYVGWAKAAEGIGPLARAVKTVGSAERLAEAPFKTGFAREVVRYAPFEFGRVAGSALFGEELASSLGTTHRGTGDVAAQVAMDLGITGAFGGTFEAFKAAGTRARGGIPAAPGVDLNQPLQLQIRKLKENINAGLVADKDEALSALEWRKLKIRQDEIVGRKAVGELEDAIGAPKGLNRLFREKSTEALSRHRLIRSASGPFQTDEQLQDVVKRAGLGEDWEAYVQFPRYVQAKSPVAQKVGRNSIKNYLKPLDSAEGLWYNRDKTDGLWIVSKQIGDKEWVLFKTDSIERFAPEQAKFAKTALARSAVFGREGPLFKPLGEGADVYDAALKYFNDVPVVDYRGLDKRTSTAAGLARAALEKSQVGRFMPTVENTVEGAKQFAKDYLAPGAFAHKGNPLAQRAFNLAKAAYDTAEGTAERLFLGSRALSEKKGSLLKEVWRGARPLANDDNIQALIETAHKDPGQWEALWKTVQTLSSTEEGIKRFGLAGDALKLHKALVAVDNWQMQGLNKVLKTVGKSEIQALENHAMLSHAWRGDWRVPIYDGNVLVHMEGGKFPGATAQLANEIVKEAKLAGINLRAGKAALAGELQQDIESLARLKPQHIKQIADIKAKIFMKTGAPTRLEEIRAGVGGYVGSDKPWTREEFSSAVLKQLRDYQTYQAKLAVEHILDGDFTKLRFSDPKEYDRLLTRINSMFGVKGEFSKAIDKAADTVLAPFLGKNSATKISQTANKWMMRFELGFANIGYNMANALSFIQTAYPQMAFISSAHPSRVAQYYTYFPVQGNGKARAVGALDIGQLTKKSFQLMNQPDEQLWKQFQRAAREGVWDPRFLEEYVGQKSSSVLRLRDALHGKEPFSNWLGTVAEILPGTTEKFSRGHSFVLGHTFFKDIMGVTDEEMLYQLAKQFTEKTNFLYTTADRSRIFTGPLGTAAGLFKTWAMNYMSWMLEYSGEAFLRGNWKPLLYMTGGTTAIGGIASVPLFGAVDSLQKFFSNKSAMEATYGAFGGTDRERATGSVSDMLYFGLPTFFGFTLQNQVSAPFADPGKDAQRLAGIVYWDRGKYLGKALGEALDYMDATGQSPARDPQTRDLLIRALAPKQMARISQVYKDETLKSLATGNKIVDQLSPVERMMYGLGLNPRWVASSYEVADILWKDQEKARAAVQNFGKQWAEAQAAGDYRLMQKLSVEMLYQNVDFSSVIKSANARLAKGEKELTERQFKVEKTEPFRQSGLVR